MLLSVFHFVLFFPFLQTSVFFGLFLYAFNLLAFVNAIKIFGKFTKEAKKLLWTQKQT